VNPASTIGAMHGADGRFIEIRGARTHNLRNVDVRVPIDESVVVVGPSGSGKSSLAFGTIHAAAHAAYLDGISSYARFMETRMAAPDVDAIRGLRPTLALAQGYGGRSSRSTVGTVTDALALLRLLFSRLGEPRRSAGELSFLNPAAICTTCRGAGTTVTPVPDRLVARDRTLSDGAIQHRAWKVGGRYWNILVATDRLPLDRPVRTFSDEEWRFLLYSPSIEVSNRNPGFVQRFTYEGIIPRLQKRISDARDLDSRSYDLGFFDLQSCDDCRGTRLCAAARQVRIGDTTFEDVLTRELTDVRSFVGGIEHTIAAAVRRRLDALLTRVLAMGLGYLTMNRTTSTMSGGELRRLRIAQQLASPLTGLVYVVDEASAGLHHEEATAVYESLRHLRESGNTVILVDHADGARSIADHVIELGPGGGRHGGTITWAGPAAEYDGMYGRIPSIARARRPVPEGRGVAVLAHSNNLRGDTVEVPRNRFVVLVGPSGSGKSSLARDIAGQVEGSALLSQRDIGATPRSVIATYLGVFDPIRKAFAQASGRVPGDFSFNGAGACPVCAGWGFVRVEMQFLEDVTSPCEECRGRRYRPELLTVRVHGRTIADVLDMTVDEAAAAFADSRTICRPLDIAAAVGIGHLVIGQSTDTLSGGEAQRIRISSEVAGRQHQVLVLDEPTRGLGFDEIPKFVRLVDRLLDERRSVVAIEHNLAVIASADWIIELGPGSGTCGGRIVASGTPEDILGAGTITSRALSRLPGDRLDPASAGTDRHP
jgi:excinuclease UvrABC ATPase subunit